jgi:hypothetical protein
MPHVDKVIVTNVAALKAKYLNHYRQVWNAVRTLIAADEALGIATRAVALDDEPTLRRFGSPPVSDPGSAHETTQAIDAVWRACRVQDGRLVRLPRLHQRG